MSIVAESACLHLCLLLVSHLSLQARGNNLQQHNVWHHSVSVLRNNSCTCACCSSPCAASSSRCFCLA